MFYRLLILLGLSCSVYAQNINYTHNNIYAFLPKNNQFDMLLGYELVNDTVDIFNIKESEFSSNTQSFDSLGDMKGYNLNLGYSFFDNFYVSAKYNQKNLNYAGSTLTNENIDIFLRYQIYRSKKFALAIDAGYVTNRAKDLYIYDLNIINNTISRVTSKDLSFSKENDTYYLTYVSDSTTSKISLENKPYIALLDTYDESYYIRGVLSYHGENTLFSLFGGYTQIDIKNNLDSSVAHENSDTIKDAITNNEIDASYKFERVDAIVFGGFNIQYSIGSFHSLFAYKLNKIYRIEGLEKNSNNEKTDINHIVDLNFAYDISDDLSFYLGGRLMSNQFNGEIHYLYTEYTNTTFDHKYGYVNTGFIYRF